MTNEEAIEILTPLKGRTMVWKDMTAEEQKAVATIEWGYVDFTISHDNPFVQEKIDVSIPFSIDAAKLFSEPDKFEMVLVHEFGGGIPKGGFTNEMRAKMQSFRPFLLPSDTKLRFLK